MTLMRFLGAICFPGLAIFGLLLLLRGSLGYNSQGLAIAGSILLGSVLIAGSLPDNRPPA